MVVKRQGGTGRKRSTAAHGTPGHLTRRRVVRGVPSPQHWGVVEATALQKDTVAMAPFLMLSLKLLRFLNAAISSVTQVRGYLRSGRDR